MRNEKHERALSSFIDKILYGNSNERNPTPCQYIDLEAFREHLELVNHFDRVSVLKKSSRSGTILHKFAALGYTSHIECVISLVAKRRLTSLYLSRNEYGYTLLHYAAQACDEDFFKAVLCSIDYNERLQLLLVKDCMGDTATHLVVKRGKHKVIDLILALLKAPQRMVLLKKKNAHGETVQEMKCSREVELSLYHYDIKPHTTGLSLDFDEAGEGGVQTQAPTSPGCCGSSKEGPSFRLRIQNRLSLEVMLLSIRGRKENCLTTSQQLKEALESVTESDRLSLLKSHDQLGTVLHSAAFHGYFDLTMLMLKSISPTKMYSLVKIHSDVGCNVLHGWCASIVGSKEVVTFTLKQMNENERMLTLMAADVGGYTPLHYAASRDHAHLVHAVFTFIESKTMKEKLLGVKTNLGQTPLDLANECNNHESINALKAQASAIAIRSNSLPDCDGSAHPQFSTLDSRLKSFESWNHIYYASPVNYVLCAESGLFYGGVGNFATCFSCNERFSLTSTEDTVESHNRLGNCQHLGKLTKQRDKEGERISSPPVSAEKTETVEKLQKLLREMRQDPPILPEPNELKATLLSIDPELRLQLLKRNNELGTVMHTLACRGLLLLIECIFNCVHSCDIFSLIRLPNDCGQTLLHFAALHRHLDVFEFVLESLVNVEDREMVVEVRDPAGLTAVDYIRSSDGWEADVAKHPLLNSLIGSEDSKNGQCGCKSHSDAYVDRLGSWSTRCVHYCEEVKDIVRKGDDKHLQQVCEKLVLEIPSCISTLIKSLPLSSSQIEILSKYSTEYVVPCNQDGCKMFAFTCFTMQNRDGAYGEALYLQESLKMVGFTTLMLQWAKFPDLSSFLEKKMAEISSKCSMLLICVMSHGSEGVVCGDEGDSGTINAIIDIMNSRNELSHIPKVFILQACRTKAKDSQSESNVDGSMYSTNLSNRVTLAHSNMVLLMSTVVGGKAVRGFYTRSIADIISQSDGATDIQAIHLAAVRQMRMHPDYDKCLQVPEFRSTLQKPLVLPPVDTFRTTG